MLAAVLSLTTNGRQTCEGKDLEVQIFNLKNNINMKRKFSTNRLTLAFASLLLAVVFLSSCNGDAKESIQDGDFKIDFLFEKDGCKVYRFKDGSRYIYWSNCSGNMQSNYYQSTGKSGYTVRMESFTNDR